MNGAYIVGGRGYDWKLTCWSPACSKYDESLEGHLHDVRDQRSGMVAELEERRRETDSVALPSAPLIIWTCLSFALCLREGSGDTTLKEIGSYSTH